jgi:hypothetical protein
MADVITGILFKRSINIPYSIRSYQPRVCRCRPVRKTGAPLIVSKNRSGFFGKRAYSFLGRRTPPGFFSCFGIGGVYQNPDDEKGGFSRPSKI